MMQGSIWPLVAAALAATMLGYVWYHPRVFGARWMRLNGVSPEMAERGATHRHLYAAAGFLAAIVIAYVMRMLLIALGLSDAASAARLGALLSLGFSAPILLGSVLWEHRPLTLYIINAGYWLVALVAMAIILVL